MEYDVGKSKEPMLLLNKKGNFNDNETESIIQIPCIVLERWTLGFSSYKYHKLKIKLWWVGVHERTEKRVHFMLILFYGEYCSVCILFQCIE